MLPVPPADQVVALAPDASALKSARELASARRWTLLARSDDWLWGLAQGSGKDPYQVQVALGDLASKCSCPSRKFPCKHALGLLLLAADNPGALPSATPPAWVAEWAAARAERADKQQAKQAKAAAGTAHAEAGTAALDEQAQKRQQKRAGRIEDGAALLSQALQDLVRSGLAAVASSGPLWPDLDRRMVDAQAPGLAGRVQSLRARLQAGAGQRERALLELGQLHTLLTALQNAPACTPALQQSLRHAVGVPLRSDDVLQRAGLVDGWFVAAVDTVEQDRVLTTVQWLFGIASGRWANVLHSAPLHTAGLPGARGERLPLGSIVHGELVHAEAAVPLRALFRVPPHVTAQARPAPNDFAELLARHADALAIEPWWRQSPFHVAASPAHCGGQPVLVDDRGLALPWQPRGDQAAVLAAITGGADRPLAGVFDGRTLHVLAAYDELGALDLAGASA